MFKNTTTKLFISFATIILLQAAGLSYFYTKVMLRESENFALETLSKRSESQASEIALKLKQNYPIDHLQMGGFRFVNEKGEAFNLDTPFSAQELLSLSPLSGSQVSVCKSIDRQPYYCSLSTIQGTNLKAIEIAPRLTMLEVFHSLAREISGILLITLILVLIATFTLAKILLRPLRSFTSATRSIAKGNYSEHSLPTTRSDEIGDLAKAFDRMMTDLKERERNIALSSLKLSHSSRLASIGQMGASIAHEVKNPLTSMIGYAKVLKSKMADPQLLEAVEIIQTEGERCNQILQQMLRFARTDPKEIRPYSLLEVIQSCLLLLKSEAKTRQQIIHNQIQDDVILKGSPQQIQQVIINLLMNAMQASPKGSTIELKAATKDDRVELQIQDHGAGIPKSLQARIFDPFFTTKAEGEGTGLGLSVAREIIQDEGGELYFTSEENKGTTFSIRLPIPSAMDRESRASS